MARVEEETCKDVNQQHICGILWWFEREKGDFSSLNLRLKTQKMNLFSISVLLFDLSGDQNIA